MDDTPTKFIVPGQMVDGYQIDEILGEGGMGVVALAHHTTTLSKFAIKFVLPELIANPNVKARFLIEAQAPGRIDHEGLAGVFSTGDYKGGPYLVMEYIKGRTLHDELKDKGVMSVARTIKIADEVAAALEAAHAKGYVHRDIKPENIMLKTANNMVKVLDFGIAKFFSEGAGLTKTGGVLGTPYTMSAEQARGGEIDGRSDIYSLTCVMYRMLSGRFPFQHLEYGEVMASHMRDTPPALAALVPSVPVELSEFLFACLAKDPADRPQTMTEFRQVLTQFADPSAISFPPGYDGVVNKSIHDPKDARSRSRPNKTRSIHGEVMRRSSPKSGKRTLTLIATGAVVVMVAIGTGLATMHKKEGSPPQPVATTPARGVVRLVTSPSGALAVTADGRQLGRTPVDVGGATGEDVDVKLTLDGFQAKVETVHVAGGSTTVESRLTALEPASNVARPAEKPAVAVDSEKPSRNSDPKRLHSKSGSAKTTPTSAAKSGAHSKDELPDNMMGQ